jgi:hypothetical protein
MEGMRLGSISWKRLAGRKVLWWVVKVEEDAYGTCTN